MSLYEIPVAAGLVMLFFVFRRELMEAIENFRGGPPTPMHPSPVNDSALLRRRGRRPED